MKVPSPRLVRLSTVSRGAMIEPGDTELTVPPVLSMSIELSSPIDKILAAPVIGTVADSFLTSFNQTQVGAVGGQSLVLCTLERGLWSLDLSFFGGFSGTVNAAKNAALNILDPDAVVGQIINMPFVPPAYWAWQGLYRFLFQRDGWQLRLDTSATVAGDNLSAGVSVHARKSL
jgi:hypothetical protein